MVTQQATETLATTAISWQYYTAEIECSRRFIGVSTRAEFQDSLPPPDAVPIPVLLKKPAFLRCSVLPMPPEAMHDTARTPICGTFSEYVASLPPCRLLAHGMQEFYPEFSLYELL
jgi:hypothetical protein